MALEGSLKSIIPRAGMLFSSRDFASLLNCRPDGLVDDDGHVADEVARADGADRLGHALFTRRELVAHVVAGRQ